jgi:hypothetical protein
VSTDRDTTRVVRSWLDEGVNRLPDRVLDAVLDQIPATHQRRGRWWPVRWFPTTSAAVTFALAAAALAIVVVLGLSSLVAPNVGAPGVDEPTPSPLPTASALSLEYGLPLDPGRYALADPFPVELSFDVDSQWEACSIGPFEQGICYRVGTASSGPGPAGIAFLIVDNVVAHPCDEVLRDPPVGPTVDDLVAAITSLPTREATEPVDASVGGFPAKRFTITHPAGVSCGNTWATTTRTNGTGATEINDVYVVDAAGTRIFITTAFYPDTDESMLSAAAAVIASIVIEP